MPMIAGMPPATDAPNSSRLPIFRARSSSSGPGSEISSLLAVTTDLPARSALRTHSPAGSRPPISSTTTSTSDDSTSSIFSVQRMCEDSEPIFFFLMLRLKICVRSRGPLESCARIFATERPTVPKPTRAIFSLRSAAADFFAARPRVDFVFGERDFPKTGVPPDTHPIKRCGRRAAETRSVAAIWCCTRRMRSEAAPIRNQTSRSESS